METEKQNGAKAFGGIMAVLAVIGGMAAIMQPLNNRLQAVEEQLRHHVVKLDHPVALAGGITRLREDFAKHVDSQGHPVLSERVKAIEANGVAMKHLDRLIRVLWDHAYEEPLPAINGVH